ncbi:putative neural-cadherin 2 isoform X2 [Eriocheir sinensis]|uniref:putative neural-cadherin 2 isoform X2 n=1 Tax=Eriocheir sinensis TaxID=95602 RepID=UPI0021C7C0C7|nr:putative neural-cadherin 2 isoform X2 [Eriocheir sinensis]
MLSVTSKRVIPTSNSEMLHSLISQTTNTTAAVNTNTTPPPLQETTPLQLQRQNGTITSPLPPPTPPPPPPRIRERKKRLENGRRKDELSEMDLLGLRKVAGDGREKSRSLRTRVVVETEGRYPARPEAKKRSAVTVVWEQRGKREVSHISSNTSGGIFLSSSSSSSSFSAADSRGHRFPSTTSATGEKPEERGVSGEGGGRRKSGRPIHDIFNASPSLQRRLISSLSAGRDETRLVGPTSKSTPNTHRNLVLFPSLASTSPPSVISSAPREIHARDSSFRGKYELRGTSGGGYHREFTPTSTRKGEEEAEERAKAYRRLNPEDQPTDTWGEYTHTRTPSISSKSSLTSSFYRSSLSYSPYQAASSSSHRSSFSSFPYQAFSSSSYSSSSSSHRSPFSSFPYQAISSSSSSHHPSSSSSPSSAISSRTPSPGTEKPHHSTAIHDPGNIRRFANLPSKSPVTRRDEKDLGTSISRHTLNLSSKSLASHAREETDLGTSILRQSSDLSSKSPGSRRDEKDLETSILRQSLDLSSNDPSKSLAHRRKGKALETSNSKHSSDLPSKSPGRRREGKNLETSNLRHSSDIPSKSHAHRTAERDLETSNSKHSLDLPSKSPAHFRDERALETSNSKHSLDLPSKSPTQFRDERALETSNSKHSSDLPSKSPAHLRDERALETSNSKHSLDLPSKSPAHLRDERALETSNSKHSLDLPSKSPAHFKDERALENSNSKHSLDLPSKSPAHFRDERALETLNSKHSLDLPSKSPGHTRAERDLATSLFSLDSFTDDHLGGIGEEEENEDDERALETSNSKHSSDLPSKSPGQRREGKNLETWNSRRFSDLSSKSPGSRRDEKDLGTSILRQSLDLPLKSPGHTRAERDLATSLFLLDSLTDDHLGGIRKEEDDEDDDTEYGECVYHTPPSFSTTSQLHQSTTTEGGGVVVQHVVRTTVVVVVKDINDNAPAFPNTTIYGRVEENGAANLSVAVVAAWDADDASEGTNARLTYSIEKNVIDERSGEAIFAVHPETGLVRTVLCCLDRETTPEYNIQVVATDGGGQKGTGTVVIRLSDVNDNSPRLARKQWDLTVQETWGNRDPDNTTLLEIAAADRDTANYFYYRVLKESGWGWEHFAMRTVGAVGQLYPAKTLDYENERQREGFRFMVQVTDRGRGGWTDPLHLDTAWIAVKLRDVNDNPPVFTRPLAHVTVREDAAPGTLLASLPAHDPDEAGQQKVDYWVEDDWGALRVDEEGSVTLRRALDREATEGAAGKAFIVAVDRGTPQLTATATLSLTVTDVNDCAPSLLPPTVFHVPEDAPPTMLGVLKATDQDVWAMGHGPPFNLTLSPLNPPHVLESVALKFDSKLDSGRGGAELWTVRGLDREAWAALEVGVVVGDAGGVSATHPVLVVVDDLNDHPMKPAAKTVYLWKTQGGGSEAPLGRVYVDDPDDWDAGDKSYAWDGPPHPLFSLHPRQGTIFAASVVREGRYALRFKVSDRAWKQRDVGANVTVVVRELSPDALTHATPITLTPTTPARLTRGWTPSGGGGGLGTLLQEVLKAVGGSTTTHNIQVVSVYGSSSPYHTTTTTTTTDLPPHPHHSYRPYYHNADRDENGDDVSREVVEEEEEEEEEAGLPLSPPSACVWLSVAGPGGVFLNPTKLQGLLGLHVRELEEAMRLRVDLESPKEAGRHLESTEESRLGHRHPGDPSSAASLASTTLPLQVVDTNITSLVTPRLSRALPCRAHEPETCTPSSCLNGGRCVPSPTGNRCVCPGGAEGWQCKILSRSFLGSGWAWVPPPPHCLPTTISMRLLTRHPHALLLYAGPMAPTQRSQDTAPTPMLALQLRHGRPQLLVEGGVEAVKVEVNATLMDGEWHDLHFRFDAQGVSLMVDRCGHGWETPGHTYSNCLARESWPSPRGLEAWPGSGPLQVGGLAHSPPTAEDHRWREAPIASPLHGCIAHLTLNGQLVDLGEPAHSSGSVPGCNSQEDACTENCGHRGACVGGLNQPACECDPGWTGPDCSTATTPATLGQGSYMRVAMSFMPPPAALRLQARVRVSGGVSGALLHVAAQHNTAAFTLHLRSGIVCASLTGAGMGMDIREACVEGRGIGDGAWHTVFGERHGDNLLVGVDDSDGWRRNESLPSLQAWRGRSRGQGSGSGDSLPPFPPPVALLVDKHEGVTVGGQPVLVGGKVVGVTEDLAEACIDDIRVSGRQLPVPPTTNGTSWGQVTTARHLTQGCVPPADPCVNTTCSPPLTCTASSAWDHSTCGCGVGHRLVGRRCEDIDECIWGPCLHDGTCTNLRPGYLCLCGPEHTGDHCQWNVHGNAPSALTAPAALAVSLVALLVLALAISLRFHRLRGSLCVRGRSTEEEEAQGGEGTLVEMKEGRRKGGRGTDDPGGGGGGGGGRGKESAHEKFLVRLRLKFGGQGTAWCEAQRETSSGDSSGSQRGSSNQRGGTSPPPVTPVMVTPDLARDDLRAYAYEGDESSSGSLTSAIAGSLWLCTNSRMFEAYQGKQWQ